MQEVFVGAHVYPWEIQDETSFAALSTMKAAGVNHILLAVNASAQLHPPRPAAWFPHNPKRNQYTSEDGRFYIKIRDGAFDQLRLRPLMTSDKDLEDHDVLQGVLNCSLGRQFKIYASLECLNIGSLAQAEPDCAVRDMEGRRHRYWLCPSNPDVKRFLLTLVEEIMTNYGIDGLLLDKIGFLWPHTTVSRLKDGIVCFCEHCVEEASKIGLNLEQIREKLDRLVQTLTEKPSLFRLPPQAGLVPVVIRNSDLLRFLRFRCYLTTRLVSEIRETVRKRNPNLKVGLSLFAPRTSWIVGQDLRELRNNCDWIKVMTRPVFWSNYTLELLKDIESSVRVRDSRGIFLMEWARLNGFATATKSSGRSFSIPSSVIYSETVKAKLLVNNRVPVYPEVETWAGTPEVVSERVKSAITPHFEGLVIWTYDWTSLRNLNAFRRTIDRFTN